MLFGGNYCLVGYVFYEVVDVRKVNGRVAHSRLNITVSRLYIRLSGMHLALCPSPSPSPGGISLSPRPGAGACVRSFVREFVFACWVMDIRLLFFYFFIFILQALVSVHVCICACFFFFFVDVQEQVAPLSVRPISG